MPNAKSVINFDQRFSVAVADIHRVKWLALILSVGYVNAAVPVLSQVAGLDQVLDALAGMGVIVGVLGGGGELLLQELHPHLHVSVLVDHVRFLEVVSNDLCLGSPTLNVGLHEVHGTSLGSFSKNKHKD